MERKPGQEGVTTVEATIGIVLLLFTALFAVQLVLLLHGALAAHSAAGRAAREVALTGTVWAANAIYQKEQSTALRALLWQGPDCSYTRTLATCIARVRVPSLMPGGVLLFGNGSFLGAIDLTETGQYPTTDVGG
jgi:hypothetical protein